MLACSDSCDLVARALIRVCNIHPFVLGLTALRAARGAAGRAAGARSRLSRTRANTFIAFKSNPPCRWGVPRLYACTLSDRSASAACTSWMRKLERAGKLRRSAREKVAGFADYNVISAHRDTSGGDTRSLCAGLRHVTPASSRNRAR